MSDLDAATLLFATLCIMTYIAIAVRYRGIGKDYLIGAILACAASFCEIFMSLEDQVKLYDRLPKDVFLMVFPGFLLLVFSLSLCSIISFLHSFRANKSKERRLLVALSIAYPAAYIVECGFYGFLVSWVIKRTW